MRYKWENKYKIEYTQCNVDIGDILVHPFVAHKGGINYSMDTDIIFIIEYDFHKMTDQQELMIYGLNGRIERRVVIKCLSIFNVYKIDRLKIGTSIL